MLTLCDYIGMEKKASQAQIDIPEGMLVCCASMFSNVMKADADQHNVIIEYRRLRAVIECYTNCAELMLGDVEKLNASDFGRQNLGISVSDMLRVFSFLRDFVAYMKIPRLYINPAEPDLEKPWLSITRKICAGSDYYALAMRDDIDDLWIVIVSADQIDELIDLGYKHIKKSNINQF